MELQLLGILCGNVKKLDLDKVYNLLLFYHNFLRAKINENLCLKSYYVIPFLFHNLPESELPLLLKYPQGLTS